jgi:chromosome segregation ATPase
MPWSAKNLPFKLASLMTRLWLFAPTAWTCCLQSRQLEQQLSAVGTERERAAQHAAEVEGQLANAKSAAQEEQQALAAQAAALAEQLEAALKGVEAAADSAQGGGNLLGKAWANAVKVPAC